MALQPGPLETAQDGSLVTEFTPGVTPQSIDFYYDETNVLVTAGTPTSCDHTGAEGAQPQPITVRGIAGVSCISTKGGSSGGLDVDTAIIWVTTPGGVPTRHVVEMDLGDGGGVPYSPDQLVATINKWTPTSYTGPFQ